jgi:hypothetical protein
VIIKVKVMPGYYMMNNGWGMMNGYGPGAGGGLFLGGALIFWIIWLIISIETIVVLWRLIEKLKK